MTESGGLEQITFEQALAELLGFQKRDYAVLVKGGGLGSGLPLMTGPREPIRLV